MFRLWGKIYTENHLVRDCVICDDREDTRTHKIFNALDGVCYNLDLGRPIWLENNIHEFQKHNRTRFTPDCFVEQIDFDFLEIQIIEED